MGVDSLARQERIVDWLSQAEFVRRFRTGEGFFVKKGTHVRLADGTVNDLFEWLVEEGIAGGSAIGGYSVAYAGPESEYGERLSFFKVDVVVDAPFSRLSGEVLPKSVEEDIPF